MPRCASQQPQAVNVADGSKAEYLPSPAMSASTSSGHAAKNVRFEHTKCELQSPLTPPFLFDVPLYTPPAMLAAWKGMLAASNRRDT
jgi:hypothetical protein